MRNSAKGFERTVLLFVLGLIGAGSVWAETTSSPIVGFVAVDVGTDSDTVLTVGFHQTPAFSGKLLTSPTIGAGVATLNIDAASIGTPLEFASTHYVQVRTGNSSGRILPVQSNSSVQVIVDLEGDSSLDMASGDEISVIPWWTLETLLPPAEQPALQESGGNFPPSRQLEVLLYEMRNGTSLSPSRIFFFTSAGWIESALGFPSADSVRIHPHSAMIVRTRSAGASWKLITTGNVNADNSAVVLKTSDSGPQDNVVGLDRPVPSTLDELWSNGLDLAFVESSTNDEADRRDELLILDNSGTAWNRAPSATYFRVNGEWRQDTAGFPESGSVEIPGEAALIVRKATTANGLPVVWINQPNFP